MWPLVSPTRSGPWASFIAISDIHNKILMAKEIDFGSTNFQFKVPLAIRECQYTQYKDMGDNFFGNGPHTWQLWQIIMKKLVLNCITWWLPISGQSVSILDIDIFICTGPVYFCVWCPGGSFDHWRNIVPMCNIQARIQQAIRDRSRDRPTKTAQTIQGEPFDDIFKTDSGYLSSFFYPKKS